MNTHIWQITQSFLATLVTSFLILRKRATLRGAVGGVTIGALALVAIFAAGSFGGFTGTAHGAAGAGNPSANLDQCANGTDPLFVADGCWTDPADWVNGSLNGTKTLYYEGDSVPYRMSFDNLSAAGPYTVVIQWDTTKSGKHALDYLTTFNRSVTNANPCLGVSGCNLATPTTWQIPDDPQVTGAIPPVTPIAGNFELFGGTITAVSGYSGGATFPASDNSRSIAITFTASVANPVLAWGGHISTRKDWGADNSAVNIPGSPYHMSLVGLDGQGGSQDRSLSADAVIYPGSITIIKNATPNGSTSFPFTASPSPLTNFNLVDDGSPTNTKAFTGIKAFKTYSVAETVPESWTLKNVVCTIGGGTTSSTNPPTTSTATVAINLQEGDNVACTYANETKPAPQLHLRKVVVNDNGGTSTVANFALTATGAKANNNLTGTSPVNSDAGLLPDTWTLSEVGTAGYTASDWVCVGDGTQNGSTITLDYSQSATCTITNNDVAPKLHLRKIVVNDNGGTATDQAFTLTATGAKASNNLSGTTPVDSAAGLNADTWALSESSLPGYAAGTWVCVGGTQNGSNITVGVGGDATCTITNDDIAPKLHLRKLVVNDNGGTALASAFTLTATGAKESNVLTGKTPVDSTAGLKADTFALTETSLAGYSASAWVCTGNGTQDGSSIMLGLAGEATCTITNDDIAPLLHLRKIVVNDNGGTATDQAFTLTATGAKESNVLTGKTPVDSTAGLKADTFALTETSLAGYSASAWVCTGNGTQDGSSIMLGLAGEATCTITNDDIAPQLHLRKVVVKDNGGTATTDDFTLFATGAVEDNSLSGTSPVDSGKGLQADTWTLSEQTDVVGYAASAWDCAGGSQEGSDITVGIGGEATCTITNDDIAPQLHLRKVVVKDNGGTATTDDFTLFATGAVEDNSLSGTSPVDSGKGLQADTWMLSESNVTGYAASDWTCVGGSQVGSSIKVGIGGEATCTITNDDIAPILHLRKTVINLNGGTATTDDFTLSAIGAVEDNSLSGTSPVDSGAGLQADTFALTETSLAGYTASAWVCDNTTQLEPAFVQDGSSLTLGLGEDVTCTITNTDIAPILHLRKVVVNDNGGTAVATDFTLTATGTAGNNVSGVSPVDSGPGLQADTWTLSEFGPAGYTASTWTCTGGTQLGTTIAVAIGGEATCTITNNDNVPAVTPPVIAPPVIAPPRIVRGTSRIAGPQGCVLGRTVATTVSGRNIDRVVFIRDGRVVKMVQAKGTGLEVFTLNTILKANMVGVHTVNARVFFDQGVTPRVTTLTRRFTQCRISPPVTG